MTWNYRVISRPNSQGLAEQFGIHEVYYDSAGRIEAWTEEPSTPFGESIAELQADMELITRALSEPILNESDLLHELADRAEERRGPATTGKEGTEASTR